MEGNFTLRRNSEQFEAIGNPRLHFIYIKMQRMFAIPLNSMPMMHGRALMRSPARQLTKLRTLVRSIPEHLLPYLPYPTDYMEILWMYFTDFNIGTISFPPFPYA
jgi:hypothetical protein